MSDDVKPPDGVELPARGRRDGWGRYASKRRTDDPAPSAEAPATEAPKDRDAGGKFAPGNRAGVGHGRGRTQREFDAALRGRVTDEAFAAIVDRLIEQARTGDGVAMKLLLDRLCGRAREAAPSVDIGLAEFTSSKDIARLLVLALAAAARGELTPGDVADFASAARATHDVIAHVDLEQRVADLENGVRTVRDGRSGLVATPSSAPDAPQ